MNSLSEDQERERYIEYLQGKLVREGSEEFLKGQKEWFEKNREKIAQRYEEIRSPTGRFGRDLVAATLAHSDRGEYDSFVSHRIFEPLLAKVLAISKEMGYTPKLPVRFANSPGIEPSPAALPSTSEHVLFAGQGTFAFCNYWAKVFSTAIAEISEMPKRMRRSTPEVLAKLRDGQVLIDATRLAVRYAMTESLAGFGKLEQRPDLHVMRVLLVNAMEVFIVAHEVAHFVAHEEHPETLGIAPGSTSKQHELECDAFALAVCTQYGVQENNAFSFQLVGPLLFFYALRICERTKTVLTGELTKPSESHPATEDRFKYALEFLRSVGAKKEILISVNFAVETAMIIGTQVQLIAENVAASFESAGDA